MRFDNAFTSLGIIRPTKLDAHDPQISMLVCDWGRRFSAGNMKIILMLVCAALMAAAIWFTNDFIAPLFLNSRLERLREKNLPKVLVEKGSTIHCQMKADGFRFPLPPGSRAVNPVVSGGFDNVEGSVEARFDSTNGLTAKEYRNWLSGKVQVGGQITTQTIPGGLLIKFHYFGDK